MFPRMSTVSVRVPKGAKWDCHGCGACCRMYELGPVEPEIIAGLEARKIEQHWPPAAKQAWHERKKMPDGTEGEFLTHVDGHCVFLREDNLCGIHGMYGADAKPGFCREFPFHVLEDKAGLVAVIRATCAGFHETSRTGTPLEQLVDGVIGLPRVVPRRRFEPTQVAVTPDLIVPLDTWLRWEEQLLPALDDRRPEPEAALAEVRDRLLALAGRAPAVTDPRVARLAGGAIVEAMRRVMVNVVDDATPKAAADRVAFAVHIRDWMTQALPNLGATTPFTPEALDWLHLLLRSNLLARQWGGMGGVADGLGLTLLQVMLVRALGRPDADGRIDAQTAGMIVVDWNRSAEIPTILAVLRRARPALVDLFLKNPG